MLSALRTRTTIALEAFLMPVAWPVAHTDAYTLLPIAMPVQELQRPVISCPDLLWTKVGIGPDTKGKVRQEYMSVSDKEESK